VGTAAFLDGEPLPGFARSIRHTLTKEARISGKSLIDELTRFIMELSEGVSGHATDVEILGCGVAMGGHVDHGVVRLSYNTGWGAHPDLWADVRGFDLRGELEERLPFDVVLDNDVTSIAVREVLTGNRASSYAVVCVLGDGVGGGLVLDGDMRRGEHGLVGEIGHLPIAEVTINHSEKTSSISPRCRCGQLGHVEAVAAPNAMARRAGADNFGELALGSASDSDAVEIFREGGTALARGIIALVLTVDPQQILLYMPPSLAVTNEARVGAHYQAAFYAELRRSFSTGRDTEIRVITLADLEMEELSANAATFLVLGRLIDKVGARATAFRRVS
jgi:predicted NBD/HSP70 family sugar kinase